MAHRGVEDIMQGAEGPGQGVGDDSTDENVYRLKRLTLPPVESFNSILTGDRIPYDYPTQSGFLRLLNIFHKVAEVVAPYYITMSLLDLQVLQVRTAYLVASELTKKHNLVVENFRPLDTSLNELRTPIDLWFAHTLKRLLASAYDVSPGGLEFVAPYGNLLDRINKSVDEVTPAELKAGLDICRDKRASGEATAAVTKAVRSLEVEDAEMYMRHLMVFFGTFHVILLLSDTCCIFAVGV